MITTRRLTRLLTGLGLAVALVLFGASAAGAQELPGGSGEGRRVVYSIGQQRVWWVESDNRVVNTYLVSGRSGTPAYGTYPPAYGAQLTSRSASARSSPALARPRRPIPVKASAHAAHAPHAPPAPHIRATTPRAPPSPPRHADRPQPRRVPVAARRPPPRPSLLTAPAALR